MAETKDTPAVLEVPTPIPTPSETSEAGKLFSNAESSAPFSFNPYVAYGRTFDFSKTNVTTGVNYGVIALPRSFVITGIFVKQSKVCDAGSVMSFVMTPDPGKNVTTATISLSDKIGDGKSDNRFFVTAGSPTAAPVFVDSEKGEILYAKFATALKSGVVTVTVIGFQPDADSMQKVETPKYVVENNKYVSDVKPGQRIDNTSKGDIRG